MKKLLFMRHGLLEKNYQDYSILGFKDLENLLTKKVISKIDREKTKHFLLKKDLIKEVNLIISSTELRAMETGEMVKSLISAESETSSDLNEIIFYEGIISKEDVEKHDFDYLRREILTKFFNSVSSEDFNSAQRRFLHFLDSVKKLEYENILCITHGWFMRLISIYKMKKTLNDISLQDLLDAPVPSFLEIIEINE
ncbi:histidine phosphatase family protein [Candidatus Woesearchaeota archaeon]|nr:histidine phosphatase family protein [Candidatus Woesearchaeota archaeon]